MLRGAALFKDSEASARATGFASSYRNSTNEMVPITFVYVFTTTSTTAITWKVRCGANTGATYSYNRMPVTGDVFAGLTGSTIDIMEFSV